MRKLVARSAETRNSDAWVFVRRSDVDAFVTNLRVESSSLEGVGVGWAMSWLSSLKCAPNFSERIVGCSPMTTLTDLGISAKNPGYKHLSNS